LQKSGRCESGGVVLSNNFKMISFLQKYTEAMTLQINAIQAEVEGSVALIMKSLQDLSASTEQKKAEAEQVLDATYLAPTAQVKAMVESIQHSTDDIFDAAQKMMEAGNFDAGSAPEMTVKVSGDDMRRVGGMFSKHMESISTLDDSVQELLMAMMGNLSNSDVIQQRLEHIGQMLSLSTLGVGNIIADIPHRLTPEVVHTCKLDLLRTVYKCYTVEEERTAFKKVFGNSGEFIPAHVKKVS
jgi:hypothetical protein